MTRETKIGLLVSLAFVIAVCVLLSDHVVNNTDAKPVELAKAGPDVGQSLAVPGQAPEATTVPAPVDANPAPVTQVPTFVEVTAPPAQTGANTVVVGPVPTTELHIANPNVPQQQTDVRISPPIDINVGPGPVAEAPYIQTLTPGTQPPAVQPAPQVAEQPEQKGYKEHVAVSGDNVAKWAKKFLGADTKSNRDLIIAANDVLKKDPAKIVVGKTYRIPVKPAPAPAAVAAAPTAVQSTLPTLLAHGPATNAAAPAPTQVAATPAPAAPKTYTVKSGDNLWKIAKGNPQLVSEIRKLNRGALKNDELKVGMTLKMPVKTANL